ncbi:hypothetical protein [Alteromonas sp. B31-7]|uniref:hypothetical protein n=1 Tax=Alteromonas sp. B31-7 TaxID=2785913 RepID=UPI0018CBA0E1|nr:hypothetical protein [Alteromonas sp. B31-7]QPL50581.1 hypothetical protein IUA53_02690 [Alteromonas sp. B31-7]
MKVYTESAEVFDLLEANRQKISEFVSDLGVNEDVSILCNADCNESNLLLSSALHNLTDLQETALAQETELLAVRKELAETTAKVEELEGKTSWLRKKANQSQGVKFVLGGSKGKPLSEVNKLQLTNKALTQVINKLSEGLDSIHRSPGFLFGKKRERLKDLKLIANSQLYSQDFVDNELQSMGLEVKKTLDFFALFSAQLELSPSRDFNTTDYLNANPDVRESMMNPLLHYLKFGKAEGRRLR